MTFHIHLQPAGAQTWRPLLARTFPEHHHEEAPFEWFEAEAASRGFTTFLPVEGWEPLGGGVWVHPATQDRLALS